MMERMRMRPAQIKECVENEPFWRKVKIACLALFMGAVSSTAGGYFDNLVFRSGMYQQHMLAGHLDQINFLNKLDSNALLQAKDPFYNPVGSPFNEDNWQGSPTYSSLTVQGIARREREDWMKMHSTGTIWFDTTACIKGPHIGKINLP